MVSAKERVAEWVQHWNAMLDPDQVPDIEQFLRAFEIEQKDGTLGAFRLNEAQHLLNARIDQMEREGLPVRILIVKARQIGCSTYCGGRQFEKVVRRGGQKCLIMADNEDNTQELYQSKVLELWEQIPAAARPHQIRSNRLELVVRHGVKERAQGRRPKRRGRSYIRVLTAGSTSGGRSRTLQHVHFSEAAYFKNDREVVNATLQTVPFKAGTSIVFESTANGARGVFYDLCMDSLRGENEYELIFFPWFLFLEYQRPFKDPVLEAAFVASMSAEEQEIQRRHRLSNAQMNWRRWAIKNLCLGDPLLFQVEYPATVEEAFLASGTCRFDKIALQDLEKKAPNPIAQGRILPIQGSPQFLHDPIGPVTLYRLPVEGREYAIGADTSEGVPGGDYSAACVYDRRSRKLMARVHGRFDTEDYGNLLHWLGLLYRKALLIVENNNTGLAVIQRLRQLHYPRMYTHTVMDSALGKKRDKVGFTTSKQTRDAGLALLAAEVSHRRIELSKEQIAECHAFVTKDGRRFEAQDGSHDDEVIALMLFAAVNRNEPYDIDEKPAQRPRQKSRIERYEEQLSARIASAGSYLEDPHLGSEY